jgi:RimJ/RimL family protein N-acetyltransferase
LPIKFLRLQIRPKDGILENISYLPQVFELVREYKNRIFDDYFDAQSSSMTDAIISLIEATSPYFWLITMRNGEMIGFVYLDEWTGSCENPFSASVTTCIAKPYWGKYTRFAGKRFVKYVFRRYKLKKLKAQVYSSNKSAVTLLKRLGFSYECTLKSETIVDFRPVDIDVYSIIKT